MRRYVKTDRSRQKAKKERQEMCDPPRREKCSCIQMHFFMFLTDCLLLLLCLYFCKWQECVLWQKRYCISLYYYYFFFKIRFLKSPLTALIVTGFCCFSSETRLYKKHTDWKKKKKKPCECSMDGCDLNLYSQCKIKTVSWSECGFFIYSRVW